MFYVSEASRRPVSFWKPFLGRTTLTSPQRVWLLDRGSLTARLRARYPAFWVMRRFEGLCAALPDEQHNRLHSGAGPTPPSSWFAHRVWVREVCLMDGHRPLVFARSVLAYHSLTGPWRCVHSLGQRPLGALLFADPCIARTPLALACLPVYDPRHRRAHAAVSGLAHTPLWARRSFFLRQQHPLLVTEVFLPTLWADLAAL